MYIYNCSISTNHTTKFKSIQSSRPLSTAEVQLICENYIKQELSLECWSVRIIQAIVTYDNPIVAHKYLM